MLDIAKVVFTTRTAELASHFGALGDERLQEINRVEIIQGFFAHSRSRLLPNKAVVNSISRGKKALGMEKLQRLSHLWATSTLIRESM